MDPVNHLTCLWLNYVNVLIKGTPIHVFSITARYQWVAIIDKLLLNLFISTHLLITRKVNTHSSFQDIKGLI